MSTPTEPPTPIHPAKCPVTGMPFFMEIDGVPTYGGPFNSFTIPEWDTEDAEFHFRNYDHDHGSWNEGWEHCSTDDDTKIEFLSQQLAAALKERDDALKSLDASIRQEDQALSVALRQRDESHAREAVLREALEKWRKQAERIYESTEDTDQDVLLIPVELLNDLWSCMPYPIGASLALTQTPPPVVPGEDAEKREANAFYAGWKGGRRAAFGTNLDQDIVLALAAYRAKYPAKEGSA